MSDEIRLERTEAGGQVTFIPRGRVMYTIAEHQRLQDDRDRWCNLAGVMHQYLIDNNVEDALKAYHEHSI